MYFVLLIIYSSEEEVEGEKEEEGKGRRGLTALQEGILTSEGNQSQLHTFNFHPGCKTSTSKVPERWRTCNATVIILTRQGGSAQSDTATIEFPWIGI